MPRPLRQSTSVDVGIGPFLDATTGVDAETGLTITQPDIRLKKNANAWGQKNAAQTLTHEENGYYEVTLDTVDTNTLGLLRLAVHESGAVPVWEDFLVLPAPVYDALVLNTGAGVRSEVITMAANVLTATAINTGAITNAKFAAGAIDGTALNATAVAKIWDEVIEGATTARQFFRGILSAVANKLAGAATSTVTTRDIADTKNRLSVTTDADGNRTAVTRDFS